MESGTIIVATLTDPNEKVWGALKELTAAGVTVDGIRADQLEDFIQHGGQGSGPGFSTEFYPTHRMEKVEWDVTDPDLDLFARRFREKMGITIQEYLSQRKG